jgi:acyl-CoA thioesterase-1
MTVATSAVSLTRRPDRRTVALGVGAALLAPAAFARAGRTKVVTILGDSVTAGLGLAAADALPAQLGLALNRLGAPAAVRAAGVSGDTTADGLARVGFSVQSDTDICLIELGGNDLLQGVDPKAVRANLTAIVRSLKARKIGVVLTGMVAPAMLGPSYAKAFGAVFPAVAHAEHVTLYSFLLSGVALNSHLNQRDSIHPNAQGVKIIAAQLAPVVARALKAHA